MRLFRVVGFVPLQKPEDEVQHVRAGFLNGRLRKARDLAAQRIELFMVMQYG
jgi:hypothetical protein